MRRSRHRTQGRVSGRSKHLAELLTSLRARLETEDDRVTMEIDPLSIVAAFELWPDLVPTRSSTLLVTLDDPIALDPLIDVSRGAIPVHERFDGGAVVLDARDLADMAMITPAESLVAVAIDGPIEPADATAIRAALRAGGDALTTEVRAMLAVTMIGDSGLRIECHDRATAAAFVGEALRDHVAQSTDRWTAEIGRPEPDLVLRVLERTGHLSIRPIETAVYPTSVDVGIATRAAEDAGPAQTSLIYDVCSSTWHGE